MDGLYWAKITGKGQVQVPKPVREALGVKSGDDLLFRVKEDGVVYVTGQRRYSLTELAGILKPKIKVPYAGLAAEEEAGAEAAVEREERILREMGYEIKGGPGKRDQS